ncbi:hypothetical protein VARIO8X_50300 [Burkholderiales bacterium 8X]|nr:hypothetical protein VARIO8X_50300 [Burkholderiales bacterium 8X]
MSHLPARRRPQCCAPVRPASRSTRSSSPAHPSKGFRPAGPGCPRHGAPMFPCRRVSPATRPAPAQGMQSNFSGFESIARIRNPRLPVGLRPHSRRHR